MSVDNSRRIESFKIFMLGGGQQGTNVELANKRTGGVNIADLTLDGVLNHLYAPDSKIFSAVLGSDGSAVMSDSPNLTLTVDPSFDISQKPIIVFRLGTSQSFIWSGASNITLNVNDSGAYPLMRGGMHGEQLTTANFELKSNITYVARMDRQSAMSSTSIVWGLSEITADGMPSGILPISKGGTGNSAGYIRTGLGSGETAGTGSTAEGAENIVSGEHSHVEGYMNTVSGNNSHGEGATTIAEGDYCHVEGGYFQSSTGVGSWGEGDYCHVEGADCHVTGDFGHGEGWDNAVSGQAGHGEGAKNTVSGAYAHAENYHNTASGASSHADGIENTASGQMAHVSGEHNVASQRDQFVIGKYNDNQSSTLFEVGNGTANDARSNAFVVQSNGNIWAQGDAYVDDVNARGELTDGHGNVLSAIVDAISEEKTVSGNPITITDALPVPAVSLTVGINPEQNLHGYDHPWAGGANGNLFGNFTFSDSRATHEYTELTGTLKVICNQAQGRGAQTVLTISDVSNLLGKTLTWSITGHDQSKSSLKPYVTVYKNGQTSLANFGNAGEGITKTSTSFVVPNDTQSLLFLFRVDQSETDVSGDYLELSGLQLEIGNSVSSFRPYSNFCPISGRTEARVLDDGANLIDETTLIAASLDPSTGQPSPSSDVKITPFIKVSPSSGYLLSNLGGGSFRIFSYTSNKSFIERSDVYNTDSVISTGATWGYIRIQGASTSWSGADPIFLQHSSVTIQLGQTIFGGTVNPVTGEGSITRKTVKGNTITWIDNTVDNNQRFRSNATISDAKASQMSVSDGLNCSKFATNNAAIVHSDFDGLCIYSNKYLYVRSLTTTTLTAFQALIANADICYTLENPISFTIDPTMIPLLNGYNKLSSDAGDMSLTYKANKLDALLALLS